MYVCRYFAVNCCDNISISVGVSSPAIHHVCLRDRGQVMPGRRTVCIYICMYVCMYVMDLCMYVYVYYGMDRMYMCMK